MTVGKQCHCLAVTHRERPCAAVRGLQRTLQRPAGGGQRSISHSATAASVICPPGNTDIRVAIGEGEVDLQDGFCECIQGPSASPDGVPAAGGLASRQVLVLTPSNQRCHWASWLLPRMAHTLF